MRRPARPVIWVRSRLEIPHHGFMPNILDLWPRPFTFHIDLWTDEVRQAETRRHEAAVYRGKYLRAMKRAKRHRPGSRRWAHCRRTALRYRDRIGTLGHHIASALFEMHAVGVPP